jgi:hypothetical protein
MRYCALPALAHCSSSHCLSSSSSLSLSQHGQHRYDDSNNADPHDIPHVLRDTLHGLTQMEEMLCSLASPCFLMWVSKGGQYKTRGNVITFSQDLANLCNSLPRLPEHLDILVVRKPGARDPSTYKDFRVRKHRVFQLLRYLKTHNPFYANITILSPEDVDLPIDGSILHRLPLVESAVDETDAISV